MEPGYLKGELETEAYTQSGLAHHGIFTKIVDGIKIHAIISGWVKYRNAHFNSILGPYFIIWDPTWMDWLPIYSWVIEHPEGTIVIDTGETSQSTRVGKIKNSGLNGWLNDQLCRYDVHDESDLNAQLKRLGIDPNSVRWVVLTHLHVDHAGGLKYFPKSEIIVSHLEYVRPYIAVEQIYPTWFNPHLIGYFEDIDNVFQQGYVLTKAGDVMIVPTPGHTFSHQSVILKTSKVNFFFAGDASFTYNHLMSNVVPGIHLNRQLASDSLQKIREFCEDFHTVYLPSHDRKSVERFFQPGLNL